MLVTAIKRVHVILIAYHRRLVLLVACKRVHAQWRSPSLAAPRCWLQHGHRQLAHRGGPVPHVGVAAQGARLRGLGALLVLAVS